MADENSPLWEIQLARLLKALTELVKIGTEALKKETERKSR